MNKSGNFIKNNYKQMKNKAKLAFEMLEREMAILSISEVLAIKGGTDPQNGDTYTIDGYTFTYNSSSGQWYFNESVVITPTTSSNSYYPSWTWMDNNTGSNGSFYMNSSSGYSSFPTESPAGGGSGSGTSQPPELSAYEIAAMSIQNGLAFNSFYNTLDAARLGQLPLKAEKIVQNLFESNPVSSLVDDLKALSPGSFKGIVIMSAVGKVLGFTQVYDSLNTLGKDLTDGDGSVSTLNVVDAMVSVGSLFIKSNILGATVSMGWLLIKGEIGDDTDTSNE